MAAAVELAAPAVPPPPAAAAASSLAPGFRFHPTDEELVRYYLRRKVCGKSFRFDAISDVDVYKVEPWDLPDLSRLKTRDLEWYFFSVLDKKYGNGSRTNRATEKGYWKTTGKDRNVYHRSETVGMKKTLVYHSGRAPKGERTNWVMHEYRLIDPELEKAGIAQDAFVLCRIFRKSGSGPKNGEQYGAPFVEEEWDEDDLVMVPKQERAEELPEDDDAYLDINDLAQILGPDTPEGEAPLPVDSYHGDEVNCADTLPIAMNNDPQKFLDEVSGEVPQADDIDGSKLFDLPVQGGADPTVKHEYIGEPSNPVNFDVDYLLDEPFFDATTGDLQFDETAFFDANDLENAVKTDPGLDMFDEYTSFFNPALDNFDYNFDPIGSENILSDSSLTQNIDEGIHEGSEKSHEFEAQDKIASSSKQAHPNIATDYSYPFLKKASCMLGSISAPPAFASEFPTKYLDSASQSSSSFHVTAGMIRLRNVSFSGSEVDWSLNKPAQVNIVFSFGLGQREVNSVDQHQIASLNSEKAANSAVTRSWLYCLFLWILVLSMSFKIGTFICPRSFMRAE